MKRLRIVLLSSVGLGIGGGALWLMWPSAAEADCGYCDNLNNCIPNSSSTTTCKRDCSGGPCGCVMVSGCAGI